MKTDQRELSRKLRQEGKSIKEIESIVGCSRSSISRWVRDVTLTDDQILVLRQNNPVYNGFHAGAVTQSKKFVKIREEYRQEGAQQALKLDLLHASACMLYWGEGTKSINQARFSNNNPVMLRIFIKFIKTFFGLNNDNMSIRIKCYTDIKSLEEIERYWLQELNMNRTNLRNGIVNYYSPYSKKKLKGKSPFGTCTIEVKKSSRVVQHIYGALNQYSKMFTGDDDAGVT